METRSSITGRRGSAKTAPAYFSTRPLQFCLAIAAKVTSSTDLSSYVHGRYKQLQPVDPSAIKSSVMETTRESGTYCTHTYAQGLIYGCIAEALESVSAAVGPDEWEQARRKEDAFTSPLHIGCYGLRT